MKIYQKFLRLGISLATVGIESGNDDVLYFCTPKGASIIGWAGADGTGDGFHPRLASHSESSRRFIPFRPSCEPGSIHAYRTGITVSDCADSDKPLEVMPAEDSFKPTVSGDTACIGMIGGADGPTAIAFGGSSQGEFCAACSALHFEPVQHDIAWRITFHEKRYIDCSIPLMNGSV